jgi:hypothetical protein
MIEGLKITVPGTEVAKRLSERAAYHRTRKGEYEQRVKTLEQAGVEQREARLSSYSDPLREARDGVQRHDEKANEYEYLARFVDVNQTFLLDTSDLARMGVLGRH